MEILGTLAEITLYSVALLIAILLLRAAFSKKLSPRARYLMWWILIARLMIPVTIDPGFHFIILPAQSAAPAAAPAAAALPEPSQAMRTPLPQQGQAAGLDDTLAEAPREAGEPAGAPARSGRLGWPEALLIVWAAGALGVLTVFCLQSLRLGAHVRIWGAMPGGDVARLYEHVQRELGLRRGPELRVLDDLSSPALTAALRPKLLLPTELVRDADREKLVFSLLHELIHYKRRDYFSCLLVSLLRAVYWFNPVVWAMLRPMRDDMESACDAQVVSTMDKQQKLRYANLLLELGEERF